jgi:hypothetical protein
VIPVQVLDRHCEAKLRESAQQRREGDLTLHPGEWRTEAEMDAVSEREVAPVLTEVEILHVYARGNQPRSIR